jgi:hypothetical protein
MGWLAWYWVDEYTQERLSTNREKELKMIKET